MSARTFSAFFCLVLFLDPCRAGDPVLVPAGHGLRVPAGFEVVEFADGKLASDIHCLTIDPQGRVVVSGRGYVRLLLDEDGDGKADRALDFAAAPKDGAMGLFWEGDSLYCVGDGGLRVYRDASGKGRERPSELLFRCRTGGEHLAHAVGRGPDGWLYLLVGDGTGIGKAHATLPTSPITDPVAGCVLRFSPGFKGCEIVADGLRNAYGMDWNLDGELFTFDSDNERCVSLPWYEFTRCYHLLPGGHHGWLSPQHASTWRRPAYFVDVVPPVATLGRGSPTGVVCYRHAQYPARYRGGLFLLDWTFGQIHFVSLARHGSTYQARSEVFCKSVGDNGFAPTAAAVHPRTGDLFVSIGGRGTRGAVYRIRYLPGLGTKLPTEAIRTPPRSLDWRPGLAEDLVRAATGNDRFARRQALELVWRHRHRFSAGQLERIVRASAGESDRGLRQSVARILASLDAGEVKRLARHLVTPLEKTTLWLAHPSLAASELIEDERLAPSLRLEGVRLVQRALGDIGPRRGKGSHLEAHALRYEETRVPVALRQTLRIAFPSGETLLDREISRTLGLIEDDDPALLVLVAGMLTPGSDPIEDVHYLAVLSRLGGKRPPALTRRTAAALLRLDRKVEHRRLIRERNWYARLTEIHAALAKRDAGLNEALVGHGEFGRPDHALWCKAAGFDRLRAAEVFVARAAKDEDFPWNADLLRLVGELPADQALPVLRKIHGAGNAVVNELVVLELTRFARPEDRSRLLEGLSSPRPEVLARVLGVIEKLPPATVPKERTLEAVRLVGALDTAPPGKEGDVLRGRLLTRLSASAGQKLTSAEAARTWLRKAHPEEAKTLARGTTIDRAVWDKRLARIDWSKGDPKRGERVFVQASCAACHGGAAALGPDLRGVAGRFSRDDLFTAILEPDKDVSPRYRTTQLTTARGQVYQGIIAYEAQDSVLMLTGPGQSIRVANTQISERRLTARSLMPAGLLDRLKDEEIRDLYAHLKSLTAR